MKERPVLFSAPMVRAILDGRKTQTRRVIKPQPVVIDGVLEREYRKGLHESVPLDRVADAGWWFSCPYGYIGDRLWVRETWKPWPNTAGPEYRGPEDMGAIYAATWDKSGGHGWKPSIHMPRWASRITLEVTGVRVERVQDISEADARAEGIDRDPHQRWYGTGYETASGAFTALWNQINAPRGYSWDVNPWVWVVEFRRVEP